MTAVAVVVGLVVLGLLLLAATTLRHIDNEDWAAWWDGVLADPDLGPLVDARSDATVAHSSENGLTLGEQTAMLREAGFSVVTPVWQCGDDHVLVAVR